MTSRAPDHRVVTLWCPDWPVVAAGVAPTTPAIVLRANRVVARSAAAAAEGVRVGHRRREAQRACPGAELLAHDPDRDAAAFEPVARAIGRFSPRVEVVEPGWACLAARGPSRYFGGDEALTDQLAVAVAEALATGTHAPASTVGGAAPGAVPEVVSAPTVAVRIGVADGWFASAVAAHRAGRGPLVIPSGDTPAFLAPLSMSWLHHVGGIDPELTGLLTRMGLNRLGQLAELRPADVLARFGPDGHQARSLAAGIDQRGATGQEPPVSLAVEQLFENPVQTLEPLVFTAKTIADQLVAQLSSDGITCTRLVVTAETDHGEHDERSWYRSVGLSAPDMVERVRWQLAGWMETGDLTAGVVLLRLEPGEIRRDDGEQVALWGGGSEADDRALRAVARLTTLVGDRSVLVPAWQGGRLPTDRYRWVPAAAVDLADPRASTHRLNHGRDRPWPGSLPSPSPTVVLAEPESADLRSDDGRSVRVSGRGELSAPPVTLSVAGRVPRLVTGWAGPWLVDERWWDLAGRRRLARMQVVTDDGAAFLVVAEHQRWWLHAAYR
ncbi:MAG: DNA polymerase Y family protein [Aquihabitans sp.]